MDKRKLHDQIVALSALMACVGGIQSLATSGTWEDGKFRTLITSLITRDAKKIEDYYPKIENLEKGMESLTGLLEATLDKHSVYYAMQIMVLEKKLFGNKKLSAALLKSLGDLERQTAHFDLLHDTILSKIGEIYESTASKAANKIKVYGSPDYLKQPLTQAKVRTLLLCGIRASGLWRANGGTKWQLMFARKKLLEEVQHSRLEN